MRIRMVWFAPVAMLLMLSAHPLISSLSVALGACGSGLACALGMAADPTSAANIITVIARFMGSSPRLNSCQSHHLRFISSNGPWVSFGRVPNWRRFQQEKSQWRDGQAEGKLVTVRRSCLGRNAAMVADVAAAVDIGVTVEQLDVITGG